MKTQIARIMSLGLLALNLGSCSWASLAYQALTYPTTSPRGMSNVVAHGDWAYLAASSRGVAVVDLKQNERLGFIPLPPEVDQIHDLSLAEDFLFALDATPPGHLMVFSLKDPQHPSLVAPAQEVPVGPFSGVSAAHGVVVVSGGTSELTLREYSPQGQLGKEIISADFGRGQPDVLLAADGKRAFVSTHYYGPYFGLSMARISIHPLRLEKMKTFPLEGAGFTPGGFKPANFPITSAISDNTLYVAHAGGLTVFDLRDTAASQPSYTQALPFHAVHVDVQGEFIAVVGVGSQPGAVLLQAHHGKAPTFVEFYPFSPEQTPTGVALQNNKMVVTLQDGGFQIIDIKNSHWLTNNQEGGKHENAMDP